MTIRPHVVSALVAGLFSAVAGFFAHNYVYVHTAIPFMSEDQRTQIAGLALGQAAGLFAVIGVIVAALVLSLGRPRR